MRLVTSLAMIVFALITLIDATSILPTTTTCTTLSTSCETACGTGYKTCGPNECYNPDNHEICCDTNTTCPSGTFCNTEGPGCRAPTSLLPGSPPGSNGTTSIPGYNFSGTSSAFTSLTSLTNGTFTITSASVPGNLTLPANSAVTATATLSNSNDSNNTYGIVAGTPTSNVTYSTTIPPTTGTLAPTTGTLAAPTSTGGACASYIPKGGVGLLVVLGGGGLLL